MALILFINSGKIIGSVAVGRDVTKEYLAHKNQNHQI